MDINNLLKNELNNQNRAAVDFSALENKIISKVGQLEKRRFALRFGVWGSVSLLSVSAFVVSGFSLYQQLVSSGSLELLSIFMTDTSIVLANRTDFLYSLAESLPISSFAGVLAAITFLLWSLRNLANSYVKILATKLYGHEQIN